MTENSEENEENELGFYDFIEFIEEKMDSINQRIGDRKEESRQRWQRAKDEVDEQKRLLKIQLQKHVGVLSDNIDKPDFVRTKDKITFSVGVANACFTPLIAGRWPELLPIIYTIQALCLITVRFFIYKHKHWHYFVYDLCYYTNLLTLIYLWILPSSKILFSVCYALSHGPLALAIILWRNSLVFHSLDKVTSIFIHIYPPLTMFTIRWLLPVDLQREQYPAIADIGPTLPMSPTVFYTVIFYLVWQTLYYAFIVNGRRQKVASGSRVTSYTWLLNDKKSFLSRLVQKLGFNDSNGKISRVEVAIYFVLQFAYMLISILPVCLVYYRFMYVNAIFLCSVFAVSVYNGASFYIDVFSRQYMKSLELLRHGNNADASKTSSASSPKSSKTAIDTSADENKKKF